MIRHEEKPESQNLSDLDLFDLSIIGMIILSPDGTILASNHVANKLFKDINGLIGKSFKALIYTDPPFELNNLFLKIQQQKAEEEQHILQLGSCNEDSFWATLNFSPVSNGKDKGNRILCQIQNISDLKRATEEVNYHNHLLNELINSIPDNIFVKDTLSRFILANLAVSKTMGAESPEELFGKTDFDFYPKKLASKYRKDEVEIIESGKAKIDIIEQVIDRDHNIHWYSTSKLPLKDSNGRIIGIMGIGREVTRLIKEKKALRKAKIAAEKADQLKTSFLANLSHEVRTPLNGILGFSQFLKQVGTNNPKTDKYIDYIIHNGKRLLNLITDIIDISKIDAGQLRLSITDLSVDDLMNKLERSAMELLAGENKKEISLKLQVDGAEKSVMQSTDAQRLEQILRILISNAVKFTDRGTITLGYTLKAGVIEYYVRDTGIGIDPKDFSQVFERFIQADNSLSRQYEGVGLGLSIASELVRLLHGEIDLKSKVNKGTEFTVSFPLKPQFKKVSD